MEPKPVAFFEVAERLACELLRTRGFDAVLTRSGSDGGLDVIDPAAGLAAQVKAVSSPVGRPVLQQLYGAAAALRLETLACFSTGGYSAHAYSYAEDLGIALFRIDLAGNITVDNDAARRLSPAEPTVDRDWVYESFKHQSDGEDDAGFQVLRAGVEAGDLASMHELGRLLREQLGGLLEAEAVLDRGARAGSADCVEELGNLYENDDRHADAEQLYRRAIDNGATELLVTLGLLLVEMGRPEEAERCYERGAVAGDTSAMVRYAEVHARAGRLTDAERWYSRALTEASNGFVRLHRAGVLDRLDRLPEAIEDYRRAVAGGMYRSPILLADALVRNGENAEAQQILRSEADTGDLEATWRLGVLLGMLGNTDEGDQLERSAITGLLSKIASGPQWTVDNIVEPDETVAAGEQRLRTLAATDDVTAIFRLGVLLEATGWCGPVPRLEPDARLDEAMVWFRRGAYLGDDECLRRLVVPRGDGRHSDDTGTLLVNAAHSGVRGVAIAAVYYLRSVGQAAEADQLLAECADRGDADCIWQLADTLQEAGAVEEAEVWRHRVASSEDPRALTRLASHLEETDRPQAEALFLRAIDGGDLDAYLAYSCFLGFEDGREAEADMWLRRGAEMGDTECIECLADLEADED